MHLSFIFIRALFLFLCTLLATTFASTTRALDATPLTLLIGAFCGLAFGAVIISLDFWMKRLNLRAFNMAAIGLFFGYLMGEAVMLVFQAALDTSVLNISAPLLGAIRTAVFLAACYLGMIITARTSEELYLSIPFIKFKRGSQKRKDLLVGVSALNDPRMLDLAATGLLDQQLVTPRFLAKDMQDQLENSDEQVRSRARRVLDILKKLEALPSLEMRYNDTDCGNFKEPSSKILRLARMLDANILSAEMVRSQQATHEGPRIINLNSLSQALKPLSQSGEFLSIKIQRYGKEPRQGVGYLDDGTMVVVNGGAEFIGETIRTQVLSVKHTTSGRMIFCNTLDGEMENESMLETVMHDGENSPSNYFAH